MDSPDKGSPTPEEIKKAQEILQRAQAAQQAKPATPDVSPQGSVGQTPRVSPDEALAAEYDLGEIPSEPDDPSKVEQAEEYLRNANLATIRKDREEARRLYREAMHIAPNTPLVLEAVADDLRERKFYRPAQILYKRAVTIDPNNARIEAKLGECALEALRMIDPMAALSERESDPVLIARANTSVILSVLLPGLGQMVSGRVALGVGLMIVWAASVVWAIATPDGISGLLGALGLTLNQTRAPFNSTVLLPMGIAAFTHLVAIFEAAGKAKRYTPKKVEKQEPPFDLPYEL